MRSAITVSLVEEARGGPFVFWHGLPGAIRTAKDLGFDAVEIFAASPLEVDVAETKKLLDDAGLKVAAVGTGAGWVINRVHLVDANPVTRENAREFIRSMILMGAEFGAPAIIGSMQGRWEDDVSHEACLDHTREAIEQLDKYAKEHDHLLIYKPLKSYETNMCITKAHGAALLESLDTYNVKLLADLLHMNIEETSSAKGIRDGGRHIG